MGLTKPHPYQWKHSHQLKQLWQCLKNGNLQHALSIHVGSQPWWNLGSIVLKHTFLSLIHTYMCYEYLLCYRILHPICFATTTFIGFLDFFNLPPQRAPHRCTHSSARCGSPTSKATLVRLVQSNAACLQSFHVAVDRHNLKQQDTKNNRTLQGKKSSWTHIHISKRRRIRRYIT